MPPPPPRAEDDPVGIETLERLAAAAPRYNAWLIERVLPWVGRRVLEIGAGVGTMSAFLTDCERVVLSDTNAGYLERLRARFAGQPQVRVMALRLPATDGELQAERLDTIICLNVLEHVREDELSLASMFQLLQPGGRLVLLVPSLPAIYGTLDRALGHFRRYTPSELRQKYAAAGFRMRHLEYFNMAGIPGWWFTGRVLRRELIPTGSLRWFDALVPLFRLERLLPWRLGQSLIAVGERPA
ncbi:MAG TPA: class I SAM-dependent methyltransferase [Gemmatimonadales bacterium]|nr:class I SAM-dependent methyltransferase [Gemmatimonadales bacterium]